MKQITFASAEYTHKKEITKRDIFLNEMGKTVPWVRLLNIIEPYYPKKGKGRPPMPMGSMFRIYFLQQWYSLSDPAAEHALYDIDCMRWFAQLDVLDVNELPKFLRKDDKVVFADAGYTSDTYKRGARSLGMSCKVNDKRKPKKNMSSSQKKQNRKNSQIRARVEHCFRVIKCQFGYKKASYKGLVKNAVQVFNLLGLANLYMLRGRLGG
ncbi:MAG: transposase [Candidatus Endonucleobacter bathymodioli]|uniref:Transposase n=1 Tax=Candidatus Endonucleibacter bathymodioli TaxID=539814 RepID=A0AA90SEA6_9GAMM|nr:transposase [Candidatus Endonucleobacter bathymodioli]